MFFVVGFFGFFFLFCLFFLQNGRIKTTIRSKEDSNPDSYNTPKIPRILIDPKKKKKKKIVNFESDPKTIPANGQYQKIATFSSILKKNVKKKSKIQNSNPPKNSPSLCSRQNSEYTPHPTHTHITHTFNFFSPYFFSYIPPAHPCRWGIEGGWVRGTVATNDWRLNSKTRQC